MRTAITILLINISLLAGAQGYRQQMGLRGGVSSGISYKLFKSELKAMEGMLSYRDRGIQLTALIETYRPMYLKHTDRVHFFSGVGAHIGYAQWYNDRILEDPIFRRNYLGEHFSPVLGLDAIIGFEYRFLRIPFVIGIDYKPYFELFGPNFFSLNLLDFGLSIKYSFIN